MIKTKSSGAKLLFYVYMYVVQLMMRASILRCVAYTPRASKLSQIIICLLRCCAYKTHTHTLSCRRTNFISITLAFSLHIVRIWVYTYSRACIIIIIIWCNIKFCVCCQVLYICMYRQVSREMYTNSTHTYPKYAARWYKWARVLSGWRTGNGTGRGQCQKPKCGVRKYNNNWAGYNLICTSNEDQCAAAAAAAMATTSEFVCCAPHYFMATMDGTMRSFLNYNWGLIYIYITFIYTHTHTSI